MNWFRQNINGILGTVVFHLVIIIIAMAFQISSHYQHTEHYTIIDTEFLRDFDERTVSDDDGSLDGVGLEQMISELRNVGSSQRQATTLENIESMSLDEIRRQYEEKILREKYGDDYERMMETNYEDLINPSDRESATDRFNRQANHTSSYSGPALVFVELDNEDRGNVYVDVPVFTCQHGGVVVIDIVVAPDGRVTRTSVSSVNGSGDTSCIVNEARSSASQSRFSPIAHGENERGKITYHFIEQ